MKQLFNYFLLWGILIAGLFVLAGHLLEQEDSRTARLETIETPESKPEKPVPVALVDKYNRAVELYSEKEYLLVLQELRGIETGMADHQKLPARFRHSVYHLKGAAHWSLWHYVDAEHAWVTALDYAREKKQKDKLTRLLGEVQRVLEAVNDERAQRQTYLASPNAGPAASLQGKIAVIYLYIKDKSSAGWSLRDRTHTINTWGQVENWLSKKAQQYGSHVTFTRRMFLVDRHPELNRLQVGDVSQKFHNADRVVQLVAEQFGHDDILSFTEKIRQQEQANQAVLVLHLSKNARSFASRCMGYCDKGNSEFVFLMESNRPKFWQALEYAQAHESLHLFGADDLYNIRNARTYAVRDIMNYPSSRLWGSTMEDITAYAVGLKKTAPKAPFIIKTYANQEEQWK
jgi:hypothetical protein